MMPDETYGRRHNGGGVSVTRTVHLHIGAGKTGTSALQAAFVRNRDWLAGHGVDYPPSPWDEAAASHKITSGNGMGLAKFLYPAHRLHPIIQPDDAFQQTLGTIHNSQQPQVLYSSEHMMHFSADRARRFRETLAQSGIELRFHFWVRNIAAHACSVYNQKVKRRRYTGDFSSFLRTHYKSAFYGTLLRASKIVGKDNVIVTSYDLHRNRLFSTFCRNLGVEADGFEEVRRTINRSLSQEELVVMRSLNATLKSDKEGVTISNKMIYRAPENRAKHMITTAERDLLQARFGPEIEKVNAFCGEVMVSLLSDDVVVVGRAPCVPGC
jgi:hypothetical protein